MEELGSDIGLSFAVQSYFVLKGGASFLTGPAVPWFWWSSRPASARVQPAWPAWLEGKLPSNARSQVGNWEIV